MIKNWNKEKVILQFLNINLITNWSCKCIDILILFFFLYTLRKTAAILMKQYSYWVAKVISIPIQKYWSKCITDTHIEIFPISVHSIMIIDTIDFLTNISKFIMNFIWTRESSIFFIMSLCSINTIRGK